MTLNNTVTAKGMHWIAYWVKTLEDGRVTISNSYDHSITSSNATELLQFLYRPYRSEDRREIKLFWNLDESLSHIFRLMTPEQCLKILNDKSDDNPVTYRKHTNFVIKGDAVFHNAKHWSQFYSLDNFVIADKEPTNAIELYRLVVKLRDALNKLGYTTPLTLSSNIALYDSAHRNQKLTADINDVPLEHKAVLLFASHTANRQGWVEVYKVGHFTDIWDYDINSSYGKWLSEVRDFGNVEYTRYNKNTPYKYKNEICNPLTSNNYTGFFKVTLTINDNVKVHPFAYKTEKRWTYPTGKFETYLTLEEIMAVYKYKMGSVIIEDGYYIKFLSNNQPMKAVVNRLYEQRKLGEVESLVCKGFINGYVGKTYAEYDNNRTSKQYNPMIAGWIFSKARLTVLDFIMNNGLENDVISISTDGVLTSKEATKTKISTDKILGTWRLENITKALVLGSGYVVYNNRYPQGFTYETAIKLMNDNPNTGRYMIDWIRPITLSDAINKFNDVKCVGQLHNFKKGLDLPMLAIDQDRYYPEYPYNGKDLLSGKIYDSEPLPIR